MIYRRYGKAAFDRTIALLGLIILAPVFAALALVVARTTGRPVFFRQERLGKHGKPFTLLKFRTMTDARDAEGALLPDAQRMTRVGSLLRRTSLDELPELVNVLKGEMSLVGPRPLFARYRDRYTAEQMRRHDMRPGITGWAQVHGRNAISWEEKFALDLWYVDHVSPPLDLRILALTARSVLRAADVNQSPGVTMSEFVGSTPPESPMSHERGDRAHVALTTNISRSPIDKGVRG